MKRIDEGRKTNMMNTRNDAKRRKKKIERKNEMKMV